MPCGTAALCYAPCVLSLEDTLALTPSAMLPLGSAAPDFSLPDVVSGDVVRLDQIASEAPALLVVFVCNHCPYVVHIRSALVRVLNEAVASGVAVVAINSNSLQTHPQDGPDAMKALAVREKWSFPFLFDADQSVAHAHEAACTPDFFLFDAERKLRYRGQFDGARPGDGRRVTGEDLSAALSAVLTGSAVAELQYPSLGCNIKWTPGNEPAWWG